MISKTTIDKEFIDIEETHIRLKTDIINHNLPTYIMKIRQELKDYINLNPDFKISLEKMTLGLDKKYSNTIPQIVKLMYRSSKISEIGPMASVAGTISELSLDCLIKKGTKNSIVENGGDIALINDKRIICGIYSNNKILENKIGFRLKPNTKPLGICTSSGKIGHSISFGEAESVTVIANSASIADALATRIANDVKGKNVTDRITNGLETCEAYKEYFKGVLIISGEGVGTIGKLPKLVQTEEFELDRI